MAIDFTDNPSNGDTITAGGRTYTYESSSAKWKITSTTALNPTLTATASGTLANGDMVVVNSDGTVSAVAASSVSSAIGSETQFDDSTGGDGDKPTATFDSNSNKVVVAYSDKNNSSYGTVVVGTVSGTSISFGTGVVFNSSTTQAIHAGFDSNSNKIVLTYDARVTQTVGASTYNKWQVTAIVGTVSGTSISFGTAVVVEALASDFTSNVTYDSGLSYGGGIAFDSNLNKVVISYTYKGAAYVSSTNTGFHAVVRVGTVSGSSISFGSRVLFNGTKGSDGPLPLIFDSNSNKIVLAYKDGNNSDSSRTSKALVGTVSGNNISFGSTAIITSDFFNYMNLAFDSNLNKFVAAYYNITDGIVAAKVGTVSGTTISFGTEVNVSSTGEPYFVNAIFDSNANKFVISYLDPNNSYYATLRECTISGTSLSLGSAEVFNSGAIGPARGVFDSNSNKVVLVYRDESNSHRKTAIVKQVSISGVTNLTASNYIGVSDAAYSDSATATIQLMGSVDDAQSGLTAGQSYYIQNNGTLSTSAGTPSVLAGTAISATKLIVKGEIAAAAAAGLLVSSSGGGVTTYANIAALPSSGNTGGDLAFVTDVKAFYGWDGTEWDRIFSGQNMLPEFTTSPAASYSLASDGTATTVTVAATDPEGFAVTYSHDTTPTNQSQATITQSGGTFTVTPSTTESNAGSFTARFKAFDGVRTNSISSTFALNFQQFFAPQSLASATLINSGGNSLGPDRARGFGVDASNRIYYIDYNTSTLYQWDVSNIISEETASPSGGVNSKSTVSIPGSVTNSYYMGNCITKSGNYVFIADTGTTSTTIKRYELTSAFDISTIQSPSTDTFSASITGSALSISISEDGTILYIGSENNRIHKVVMTTAFDLSTASIVQTTSTNGNNVQCVDPTGTRVLDVLYVNSGNSTLGDRLLSTAHDLSTIGSRSNVVTATTSQLAMGAWTADGNYAVVGSQSTDKVFIYKLT